MNWLKRLFKKKIYGKELEDLIISFGKDKKFILDVFGHERAGYNLHPYGKLDVEIKSPEKIIFDLDLTKYSINKPYRRGDELSYDTLQENIKKTILYKELSKNPVLKKYVKGKSLEKSLSIISIVSVLASAFFISNNITGNAILTTTSNSSGIIGAGLFVLGLVSFILARNI